MTLSPPQANSFPSAGGRQEAQTFPNSAGFQHKDIKLPFCVADLPSLWLFVPLHLLPSILTGLQSFETLFSLAPCTELRVHFSWTFSNLLGYGVNTCSRSLHLTLFLQKLW